MSVDRDGCPCGRDAAYAACCGVILDGGAAPRTAEDLMRARYTAYTRAHVDFILATHELPRGAKVDRGAVDRWARGNEWLGLTVVATEAGGPDDERGTVEFIARYRPRGGGTERTHHERSRFARREGGWRYLDGDEVRGGAPAVVRAPVTREGPKVGRNQPCPCGSGKKWKHCHGS